MDAPEAVLVSHKMPLLSISNIHEQELILDKLGYIQVHIHTCTLN